MAKKIERFEDLKVWRKAQTLMQQVYEITKTRIFSQDRVFGDRRRREAISVMANVAEGFGRRTHKEFVQFLINDSNSVAELKWHLYVAFDQNHNYETASRSFYKRCEKLSRKSCRFIDYLQRPRTSHFAPHMKGVILLD